MCIVCENRRALLNEYSNNFSVHHEVTDAQRKGALVNERMLSEYRAYKLTPESLYDFFQTVRDVASSAASSHGVLPAEIASDLTTLSQTVITLKPSNNGERT
jgi:hypothetical protein